MQKLAILGGTFNPIHWGHLLIAETALNQVQLDRVIWVPAYQPSHKPKLDLLDFEHRYEMVQRAIAPHPGFVASAIEQTQSGSYAINTLQALQAAAPGCQWYWIIGIDAFRSLPRWYACRALAKRCCWLVAPRSDSGITGQDRDYSNSKRDCIRECIEVEKTLAARSIAVHWQILEMPLVGISSSLVRRYCQQQYSIRYLVPDPVRDYILEQSLYKL